MKNKGLQPFPVGQKQPGMVKASPTPGDFRKRHDQPSPLKSQPMSQPYLSKQRLSLMRARRDTSGIHDQFFPSLVAN